MQELPTSLSERRIRFAFLALVAISLLGWVVRARGGEDRFADFIRKTDARTPAEEQKGFHLPPGFEIQLVASEPDIGKPMNMAFDERGRLWLTQSREYPFAAPTNQPGRDAIKILSDFDESGRARGVTTFAEGLNIPIGLYPYRGGAIVFSIPAIYRFEDTNGDGRADKREVLYSGQGYDLDTHGLTSAFRRGYDGWLYACHGYRNNTTLKGTDGHTIKMNSGNIYRMRPDGSRVEQFTFGQVNPFGLQFDPLGDLWSADCHSSPVYMLLRGAYYPSFGKPHDGLGFGPNICEHSHGSTAICGIVVYDSDQFPANYRGDTFIGNVMTCRINRDSYAAHGSTRIAKEEPDFLRSDDPWFRPVDLQLGPDGAIYVADFYNRIIGHYEVPLDHPGRDRERGRIWRIVYRGDKARVALPQDFDLSKANAASLINQLGSPNLTVRMQAMNQLVDRLGQSAVTPIKRMMRAKNSQPTQRAHGLWVLQRLAALDQETLANGARDSSPLVRVHAMRVLSETFRETGILPESYERLVFAGLNDLDACVQRAAADALGEHAHGAEHQHYEPIRRLLDLRLRIPAEDLALLHTCRMALRNQLRPPGAFPHLQTQNLREADSRAIADVALGVPGDESASFLLEHLKKFSEPREVMLGYLRHAGRYAPQAQLNRLPDLVRSKFPGDPDAQFAAYKSVQEGFSKRGVALNASLHAWAVELAAELLAPIDPSAVPWISLPVAGMDETDNPWRLQRRKSADGDQDSLFLSSLPAGETLTGIIRSRPFSIPAQLTFFLAGHDGEPDRQPVKRNFVRLLDAATHELLSKTAPPRNDLAQRVTWDLSQHAGQTGVLELVDGHDDIGYAWLAAGRFEPPVVTLPEFFPSSASQRQQNAADLARTVPLPELENRMLELFAAETNTPAARAATAHALVTLNPQSHLALLARNLADTNQPVSLREGIAFTLAELNSPAARDATLAALGTASRRVQIKLAQVVAFMSAPPVSAR